MAPNFNQSATPKELAPLRRALVSVSNKSGLQELCTALSRIGCELFATSSTAAALGEWGLKVNSVESLTGFPEILGGRVKTLHPKIFGGILSRGEGVDAAELTAHGLLEFDLVVCNLYPFAEAASKMYEKLNGHAENKSFVSQHKADNSPPPNKATISCLEPIQKQELIEKIDIGGVTLLRAAAKNCARVAVLCDPADYKPFLLKISESANQTTAELRAKYAIKAFKETAFYDFAIVSALEDFCEAVYEKPFVLPNGPVAKAGSFVMGMAQNQVTEIKENESSEAESQVSGKLPAVLNLQFRKLQDLRYGENPHQQAAFYAEKGNVAPEDFCSLAHMECFHGKALSYNNVLDVEHGVRLVNEFSKPAAVILKHNVPCGVAVSESGLATAYRQAFACDEVSPFGGIVCFNRELDIATSRLLFETFLEVIVAPGFSAESAELLERKKNLRLVKLNTQLPLINSWQLSCVQGGILVQSYDNSLWQDSELKVVTATKPDEMILPTVEFAYRVVKHLRSNAIAIVSGTRTIALAGGFTNRVEAVRTAVARATQFLLDRGEADLKGTAAMEPIVVASDAFFPFADSIELLSEFAVDAVVQPGGSVQDAVVIDAADRIGIPMFFTGCRHFKH